jgi:hypothetical protein
MIDRPAVADPGPGFRPSRDRHKAPPVFVSAYEPVGRRHCWWYAYRCPLCRAYQFGRATSLDKVTGQRRGGCGHQLTIMIARTYGRPGAAA